MLRARRDRGCPGTGRVRRRAVVAAGLALAAGAVTAGSTLGDARTGVVPRLPVLGTAHDVYDGDVGDPFVLPVPGAGSRPAGFVLFGTDDPPDHVPTARSPDLGHWARGPDAVPVLPGWADRDERRSLTWAPAAMARGDRYLLYVSVEEAGTRRHCIAVLRGEAPEGPYRDALGRPLVCQRDLGGSIDPGVVATGGGLHLLWKSDGNCCSLPVGLWEQDLRGDGLALTGRPHRLLRPDRAWQGGIVENPAMIPARSGGFWLFYSGNRFDSAAYATGLAYCPRLEGPCRETGTHPFLSGTDTQYAPGGMDFVSDAHGQLWAAFATWDRPSRNGRFYCCRSLDIAPVLRS